MFAQQLSIDRFENVTVPIGTGGTQFNFPDQPDLRDARLDAISVYYGQMLPLTPTGANVPGYDTMRQLYLVLYVSEVEFIKIPLTHLVTQMAPNVGSITSATGINSNGYLPLGGIKVIWSKSYVKALGGTFYPGANYSFMFGVFYKK